MPRLPLLLITVLTLACARETPRQQPQTAQRAAPPGNAERGRALIAQYGCNTCHVVPGVEGPQGALGPSLAGIGARPAISFGTVQNTPANLTQFIQEPASLNPQSTMPAMGLADADAEDVTAYLLTLK